MVMVTARFIATVSVLHVARADIVINVYIIGSRVQVCATARLKNRTDVPSSVRIAVSSMHLPRSHLCSEGPLPTSERRLSHLHRGLCRPCL